MSRTVGNLVAEVRQLLNDTVPISGLPRFDDSQLTNALNDALLQTRAKRPDAFLRHGLRKDVPVYVLPDDEDTRLALDDQFYPALLYYVVGRSELTEDTFATDGRAVTLLNRFVAQLLKVPS